MPTIDTDDTALAFDEFIIFPRARRLLAGGTALRLGSRAFDTLLVLIEAEGRVVPKGEFLNRVWPHTVVEEANISVQISAIRKVLGDGRGLVQTDAGRGYRFTGRVHRVTNHHTAETLQATAIAVTSVSAPRHHKPVSSPTSSTFARQERLPPTEQGTGAQTPGGTVDKRIEIVLGRGRRIFVGPDVDPVALRRVLDVLERQ